MEKRLSKWTTKYLPKKLEEYVEVTILKCNYRYIHGTLYKYKHTHLAKESDRYIVIGYDVLGQDMDGKPIIKKDF